MVSMLVSSGADLQSERRVAREFVTATEAEHGHSILSDHLRVILESERDTPPDLVIGRAHNNGETMAVAMAAPGQGRHVLEVVIPHAHDNTALPSALAAQLIAAVADETAEVGAHALNWWVSAHENWADTIALALSMRPERELLQMRMSLTEDHRSEFASIACDTDSFDIGSDIDGVLRVNNRAFANHPEQGGWTRDDLSRRLDAPWFNPADVRVHRRDGDVIAFCWTKRHDATEHDGLLGEIYVVAVDPDNHGTGLGRGIVAAGLHHIGAAISSEAMLYVDASNEAAVNLYTRLGMGVHHRERAWVMQLGSSRA